VSTYWVAHARGCNFAQLRRLGFTAFYPAMDDYVFLEVNQQNEKYLRKQSELGIAYLKKKGTPVTITQKELEAMAGQTVDKIEVGKRALAVQGFAEHLSGEVLEVIGNKVRMLFDGYKQKYNVEVDIQDLVPDDGTANQMNYNTGELTGGINSDEQS
jgi:hypothetical protein